MSQIEQTIQDFPRDKKYALIVKFDIAQLFSQIDAMQDTIRELEVEGSNSNTVVICKSKLLAAQNKVKDAIEYFSKNISFFTDESKASFCERLRSHHI